MQLISGGTEICALLTAGPGSADGPPLLLQDLPRATSVQSVQAHALLHVYRGGPTTWRGRLRGLTADQERALTPDDLIPEPTLDNGADPSFDAAARRLLAVLARDGRATLEELAAVSGWSAATAARRVAQWRRRGALFLDVEFDEAALGVGSRALLWLSVAPRDLDATGVALAEHDELALVAAVTGTHALTVNALTVDQAALHRYVTGPLAALPGIRALESTPVLRTIKSVGPLPGR